MTTWAIVANKGGVGKSLMTVHFAVCAARRGKTVAVIDLDSGQESVTDWARTRKAEDVTVVPARAQEVPGMLDRARAQGVDLVILDTPGRADITTAHVLDVADVVLVPVRPFKFDIEASAKIAAEISAARRVKLAAFVLNSVPPQGTRHEETRAALEKLLTVAPVELRYRMAYCDALNDGRSVEELDPKGKAACEIRKLYHWISKV